MIKDFVPPILIKLLKNRNIFEATKEYESYSEALQVCTSDAYENIELCNMIADKTILYLEALKEKPFNLNPTNVFLLSAINQYINVYSKRSLRILDFGGSCGAHYFEIRRFIPNDISLEWYVVETDQMVKAAIDRRLNNEELHFVSAIKDVKSEIDFIHSSGALQYVPSPYEFLNMLINIKANWIFVNRMMFNENNRDIVTVQKSLLSSNGPGKLPTGYKEKTISYPHTTMSFHKFNSALINNDYNLEWIFEELSGHYQIKNEKIIGKGLLYVKK